MGVICHALPGQHSALDSEPEGVTALIIPVSDIVLYWIWQRKLAEARSQTQGKHSEQRGLVGGNNSALGEIAAYSSPFQR